MLIYKKGFMKYLIIILLLSGCSARTLPKDGVEVDSEKEEVKVTLVEVSF